MRSGSPTSCSAAPIGLPGGEASRRRVRRPRGRASERARMVLRAGRRRGALVSRGDASGRAAVLGGNRIPFARRDGAYAHASNQDMLTAALDGLVGRFGLQGERLGEVVAGARAEAQPRLQPHPRVRARQPRSPPRRPPTTSSRPAARPGDDDPRGQQDRASARSSRGIAGGVDTTSDAPIEVNDDLRRAPAGSQPGASRRPARLTLLAAAAAGPDRARDPAERRAAHRPVDGRAPGDLDRRAGASRAHRAGRARRSRATASSPPPTTAASSTTSSRPTSGSSATRTCAPTRALEKLAKLKPVFGDGPGRAR